MTDEEINYDLLEVEKGNKRYGIYLKNHIQDIQKRSTEMYKENKLLKYQLQQKENIIKEAIEYIQDRYDGEALTHTFDKDNVKELLEILKGSDKE